MSGYRFDPRQPDNLTIRQDNLISPKDVTIPMRNVLFLFILSLLFTACGGGDIPIPKPRSYPRVDYPIRAYINTQADYCPFSFDMPTSATMRQDSTSTKINLTM